MRARKRLTIFALIIALLPVACATKTDKPEDSAEPATVRLEPKAPPPAAASVGSGADHLQGLPPAEYGNRVDWVQALETGEISPLSDLSGEAEMEVLDQDIIMPVKASMMHVRFSHKVHTEWVSCGSCHDGLFELEQGKSDISMAKIIAGESCGVCHGSVAFPIEDCKRCHNVPRDSAEVK